jgi:septum formation protein
MIDENLIGDMSPDRKVEALAVAKCREISNRYPDDIVIGADTVVVVNDEILGKPRDYSDACSMLTKLSGRTHRVITGISVSHATAGLLRSTSVSTKVTFRMLTYAEIRTYVETGEPMDKAGAYAIQGKASLFVESIDGDYFNIVGLPLARLTSLLNEFGLDVINNWTEQI